MKSIIAIFAITVTCTFTSCKEQQTSTTTAVQETPKTEDQLALVPTSWITDRVTKAKKRLNTSDAGQIVWQAMEAHGGLEKYFKNGPLTFRFDYVPLDGSTRRYTYQTIDTWTNKARHWSPEGHTQSFGWDGRNAWKHVKDTTDFPFDMRFWALTPYYFLGQPFVLDGEGVQLEKLEDKTHKNVAYDAIKVTFAAGTGDAPDDYYVLYFGKDNHKLAVIRYIVSYPKYFPDGGHLPEKFMEIQGTTLVDGIEFATGYHTHWLTEDEKPGEHITTITVDNIAFSADTEKTYFNMPPGGVIIE